MSDVRGRGDIVPTIAQDRPMIPFDDRFKGHGVTPKDMLLTPEKGDPNFSYGKFGFHPEDSAIHVIDPAACVIYDMDHPRNWKSFRDMELTEIEKKLPREIAARRLISRCVKLVRIANSQDLSFEPDSWRHDIMVRAGADGRLPRFARGEIIVRSVMNEDAWKELSGQHQLRSIPAKKCKSRSDNE